MASDDASDGFRIQRTSTVEQVADALRRRILRGDLPPGTPLREVGLAESMGVARNTVREGIRRLQAERLVDYRIHKGAVVATLTEQDVREIYEIRRYIEFEALKRCDVDDVRLLTALAESMVGLVPRGDAADIVDADMHFHQALVDCLGNSRVSAFFASTLAELRIVLCLAETGDASEWVPLHLDVCRLLRRGDRDQAIEVLADHFRETEDLLAGTLAAVDGR